MYSINFTVIKKKFCLSLHYNGANSYLFANGTEIYKFNAKYSESVVTPLCLANISKDWLVDNMKKLDLMDTPMICVDYDATDADDIGDIHKYLIKKNKIVQTKIFGFVKKVFFTRLTILSSFTRANSLICISMNNQECKTGPQVVNVNEISLCFFHLELKQVNVVVVVVVLIIRMQKFVFLM